MYIPIHTNGIIKLSFKLVRSSSDQTPSPGGQTGARSPTHNPGFQALSKIRKSLREKRPGMGPRRQLTVEDVSRELVSVRDDLQVY